MTVLHISDDLALPSDAVTQAIGILARRGAGKTHTASVLVEEVIEAGLPVVVLDPTGAWWGLRSSADGKEPGLSVVILGGEHGDVPLEETAGKLIADVVVDHPGAYVIDRIGYGKVSRGGQVFPAHRVSYDMKVGARGGLLVLHRCDNPPCVRPSHLFLGTHLDNAQDRDAKGRNRFSRGPIS